MVFWPGKKYGDFSGSFNKVSFYISFISTGDDWFLGSTYVSYFYQGCTCLNEFFLISWFHSALFNTHVAFVISFMMGFLRSTLRTPECHPQWQIPPWDTTHFVLSHKLISLVLYSKVLLQLSISPSRSTLSWHSYLRLFLIHYWLFVSLPISEVDGVNQCDKDSGPFSPTA